MSAASSRTSTRRRRPRRSQPIEYSLLLTATLCLLAFGVVMVFSASSTTSLLGEAGDGAYYLKRTALFGLAGLAMMRVLAVGGVRMARAATPILLGASFVLLVMVLMPGTGVEANGARRWIGAGLFQVQPSELAKLALVLYAVGLLAGRPRMVARLRTMVPLLAVVACACVLIVLEPDLGTAMVIAVATAGLLLVAGAKLRHLTVLGMGLGIAVLLAVALEPYRVERLVGFLDPASDPGGSGFQAIQAQIALGSGGIFGVGLGESLQKAYYLPEAHTDMIAAVIGEELGLLGILALVGLYGLFGYAGLRTAQRARDRYSKLLAAGLTTLVLVQAVVNFFAVLGLAPLTGVPLPFVSYGNSNLLVMLSAVGLILNVASGAKRSGGARLRVVEGGRGAAGARRKARMRSSGSGKSRHSRGRHSGTRRTGNRRRRRATG